MKLLLLPLLLMVSLTGCLDLDLPNWKATVENIHIKKGGSGTVRMELLDITPSKEGEEGKKQIADFIQSFKTQLDDDFEGCADVRRDIAYDSDGKLNAFVEGESEDIFNIIKIIDGSKPYRLRKEATFAIQWDGDVLSIDLGYLLDEKTKSSSNKQSDDAFHIKFVITTEGEFVNSTIGQISENRKMLVIHDVNTIDDITPFGFKIRGLAQE